MAGFIKDYVSTRFGRVHHRRSATAKGRPPLVLLHQTASASVMFESLMARLEADFFLFAPDTPGFGGTDPLPEPVSVAAYAEVIHAALQAIGIDSCFLFGHHTGASIAVALEAQHPGTARKLALCGPPALTPEEQVAFTTKVEPFEIREDGSHLLAAWARVKKKEPEAPLSLLHRELVLTLGAREQHRAAYDAVFSHDLLGDLSRLRCPTMVMAGDRDLLYPYLERAHRSLERSEKHVLPGAGTYVIDRDPDRVADLLRAYFLEGPQ